MKMKMITIQTSSIIETNLCDGVLIVKQQKSGSYIKNWFCEPMTKAEYEKLIKQINTQAIITLKLKEGK